jgi:hypothetical protein
VRLIGLAEAAEDGFVFVVVFLGQDHEGGGAESMLEAVTAAPLLAAVDFGSAFPAVGGPLPF